MVSDFLVSKDEKLKAYELWNNLSEFHPQSAIVWKNYTLLALQNGVKEYAENGLSKLRPLLQPDELSTFQQAYNSELDKLNAGFE